jgi:hypothetical protein
MAIVLPYSFSSLFVPVMDGEETYGVLVVLRTAVSGRPLTAPERHRMRAVADRLGSARSSARWRPGAGGSSGPAGR